MKIRIGILTIDSFCACKSREDLPGVRIREMLPDSEYEVVEYTAVPNEVETVRALLRDWASRCDVVITNGSTGLGPHDVAPEATRSVIDRECPGIAEAIRAHSYARSPHAILSRGLAGTIGSCLVVNIPGHVDHAEEAMDVLLPVLAHAVEMIKKVGAL